MAIPSAVFHRMCCTPAADRPALSQKSIAECVLGGIRAADNDHVAGAAFRSRKPRWWRAARTMRKPRRLRSSRRQVKPVARGPAPHPPAVRQGVFRHLSAVARRLPAEHCPKYLGSSDRTPYFNPRSPSPPLIPKIAGGALRAGISRSAYPASFIAWVNDFKRQHWNGSMESQGAGGSRTHGVEIDVARKPPQRE